MIREGREIEHIVAAAIKQGEMVCFVPRPGRHSDVIRQMAFAGIPIPIGGEQGFVTSSGRFVDRLFGKNIARGAGQVLRDTGPKRLLFSEDMW